MTSADSDFRPRPARDRRRRRCRTGWSWRRCRASPMRRSGGWSRGSGAGLVVSEMTASADAGRGRAATRCCGPKGRASASTWCSSPAARRAGWRRARASPKPPAPTIIDINMGCPARQVTGGQSGSALMRDLDHALTLIEATVGAVSVPVTLKMRLGWDDRSINAPELARRAEAAGVRLITVHGRTRCQFYKGRADWAAVRAVKDAVVDPGRRQRRHRELRRCRCRARGLGRRRGDGRARARRAGPGCRARSRAISPAAEREAAPPLADAARAHRSSSTTRCSRITASRSALRHARKHLGWALDAARRDRRRAGRRCSSAIAHRVLTAEEPGRGRAAISPTPIDAFARREERRMSRARSRMPTLPLRHRRRRAQRAAASGDHGRGRRHDRRRQCGGGSLLRSLAAAAAPPSAARPGAVRQPAAGADRAGARARRARSTNTRSISARRAIRASAWSTCTSRRCRSGPTTSW